MNPIEPLVSIILPTYNRAAYLAKSIEGILSQEYENFELIIIDDGATDNTEEVVSHYQTKDSRIQYVRNEENLKIIKTLNKGLRLAKGTYIARADDDDVWIDPKKLRDQVFFLETHPEYTLVGTGAIVINENDQELFRYLQPETDESIRQHMLLINPFIHPTVVFRASILNTIGYYDETLKDAEDWDMWLRIGMQGKFYNLPSYSILRLYGLSGASIKNRVNLAKTMLKLIKKYKNNYPHFLSAYLFNYIQRLYIYLPYNKKVHDILFRVRRTFFSSKKKT